MHIKVRVTTEAKKNILEKINEDLFKVSVKANAEGGAANKAVQTLLEQHFGSRATIRLVSGHVRPHKIYSVSLLFGSGSEK